MALIKTDYGLVYNDDGSLCVTVREDDIPFPGVKSFAVEDGTTNLFTNPLFADTNANGIADSWGYQGDGKWSIDGNKQILEKTTTDTINSIDIYQDVAVTEGIPYSISAYVDILEHNSANFYALIYVYWYDGTTFTAVGGQQQTTSGRIKYENLIPPTGTTSIRVQLKLVVITPGTDTAKVAFYYPQLEQKPFATSYVDNSRNAGTLTFSLPLQTGRVFSAWVKPQLMYTTTSWLGEEGRIFNYEIYSDSPGVRFMYEKSVGVSTVGTFGIRATESGNNHFSHTTKIYNPNYWYFVVFIIFDDGTSKAYIFDTDGTMETITNSYSVSAFNIDTLIIGSRPVVSTVNGVFDGLISNPFIGQYKDANGNVIWTDDYIKYVYEQKKPFYVAKKLYL